jgi:hypothetical protein
MASTGQKETAAGLFRPFLQRSQGSRLCAEMSIFSFSGACSVCGDLRVTPPMSVKGERVGAPPRVGSLPVAVYPYRTGDGIQTRERTQCANCDLVQFRTKRNACRRCRAPLPERQPLPELKLEAPLHETPALKRAPCTAPLGMIPPLEDTVRRAVLDALDKCEGNVLLAAKCLAIGKNTVYRYLRRWGWMPPYTLRRKLALANCDKICVPPCDRNH